MITLTKLDGNQITVNADEIETVECNHDTTLGLKSGKKIIVRELPSVITEKVIEYRQRCNAHS
ncbi:MAG: flagellar FlbD family protein [Ignavibacteria bacterium]|nr:flagellar FlbD family protein [Ignavibacteria bacterium]